MQNAPTLLEQAAEREAQCLQTRRQLKAELKALQRKLYSVDQAVSTAQLQSGHLKFVLRKLGFRLPSPEPLVEASDFKVSVDGGKLLFDLAVYRE